MGRGSGAGGKDRATQLAAHVSHAKSPSGWRSWLTTPAQRQNHLCSYAAERKVSRRAHDGRDSYTLLARGSRECSSRPTSDAGEVSRKRSRPVSRVLSRTIIPLESPSPATSSGLPGSAGGHPLPLAWRLPYLALLQVGFAVPPNVATGAVRSYRTVSPLPASLLTLRRFIFCCTFRRLTPPRRYLAPRPQEPGLSSTFREKCSDRPADSKPNIAA